MKATRVFVTGWDGLVGRELRGVLGERSRWAVAGGDLPGCDVTDAAGLRRAVRAARPRWVVHLAAWTDVDGCEADETRAMAANATGALNAALAAKAARARLLLVSTDYVFDGRKRKPYDEDDRVHPRSVYGRSKAEGERLVRETLPERAWTIVRGQSLYGAGRKSFPDAILARARTEKRIPVVHDQTVSPTWARDFARALKVLLADGHAGLFHVAAAGACTWFDCARAVLHEAGVSGIELVPTTAAALARPAPRPANSVFDCTRYVRTTGKPLRPWRDALREYLRGRPEPRA